MSIEARVLQTISQYNMISRGDKILVAVSGGADSVCLLSVLDRLKNDLGFGLYCAHVNHGLRGEAADSDQMFVQDMCSRRGIKFFSKKVDVAALAKEKKVSTEEAGRGVRYDFFNELLEQYGFQKIATAHNRDDNAETIMMRIIRGTGIDGLGGIKYVRDELIIRPILDIPRCDIEKYCKEKNLDFCTDATNFENDYTRNKIRNELIPYLEREFNSNIKDTLVRLGANAKEDGAFLNGYAERLYSRLNNPIPSKKPVSLHIDSLKMVEKSIRARLIRIAADEAVKGVKLEKKHIDEIYELVLKDTGAGIDLPEGLRASVNYGWLTFEQPKKTMNFEENDFFYKISPGEEVFIENLGVKVSLKTESSEYKCGINEWAIDLDKLEGRPLFLRNRRDGDRMVWFSDGREKKIKKIFIDAKIPKADRDKIPLLCTGDEVVAVVGNSVSFKYKATKDTERALVIVYGPNKR